MGVWQRVKARLVEALGGSLIGSYGTVDSDLDGFRRLTDPNGQLRRDLAPLDQKRMLRVALYLYQANLKAQRLVNMRVALTVGAEVGFEVRIDRDMAGMDADEANDLALRVRQALTPFWEHPTHNLRVRAAEYATTFLVTGELFLPVASRNSVSGVLQLDSIDPDQVTRVEPIPGSILVPGRVFFTPAGSATEKPLEVIRETAMGEFNLGDEGVLFFRLGKILNQIRGVSDLLATADWMDAHDQFVFATVDRATLRNNLLWVLKLQGTADEGKLRAEADRLARTLAQPGGVYAVNDQMTIEALSSKLEGSDAAEVARLIRTFILGGKGIPESWYSDGGNANRATAGEQTDVAYKDLAELQAQFRRVFRTLLHVGYYSIQRAQGGIGGERLPALSEPWFTLEPVMPTIAERDTSRAAAAFVQTEAAIEGAIASELLSRETGRRAVATLIGKVLGETIDADDEARRIEQEGEEREKSGADAANRALADRLANLPPDGEPDGGEPEEEPQPAAARA